MTEKQDLESPSKPGIEFEAFNISEAKRISTRRQKVKGTVLVLEELTGRAARCLSQRRGLENGRTRKRHPTKSLAWIGTFFLCFPLPISSCSIQFAAGAWFHPVPQSIRDLRDRRRWASRVESRSAPAAIGRSANVCSRCAVPVRQSGDRAPATIAWGVLRSERNAVIQNTQDGLDVPMWDAATDRRHKP